MFPVLHSLSIRQRCQMNPAYLLAVTCVFAPAFAEPFARTELLGKLPLRFEEEVQLERQLGRAYVARGQNYRLVVSADVNILSWGTSSTKEAGHVCTRFVGANRRVRLEPLDQLTGSTNYFLGA